MRLDREALEVGRVSVDIADADIVVRRRYVMRVTYTAGPGGVSVGGCVRFKLPGLKADDIRRLRVDCSNPQVKLTCSDTVPVVNGKRGSEFFTLDYLFVTIGDAPLREGDTISFKYGDQLGSMHICAPLRAQRWRVEAAVDPDGSRRAPGSGLHLVKDPPAIGFFSDVAAKIELTVPSTTVLNEPFDAVVRVRDAYNNVVTDYTGTVKLLEGCGIDRGAAQTYTFTEKDRGVHVFESVFQSLGVNRTAAMDEDNGIYARSNPSRTTPRRPRYALYWGDTHAHSSVSADTAASNCLVARPAGVYEYARCVADLDFCMVTDHSQDLVESDWAEIREAAETSYEPGKFVTFLGFEATHEPLRRDGDRNVYFLSSDGTYVNEGAVEDLFEQLRARRHGVMVIPHQHARTNWERHDPQLERVVEIYSHWGCGLSPESQPPMIPGTRLQQENYVSHALESGIRIGFIASADHSGGCPGDDFWWRLSSYNGGLAAVYAPTLTREDVWDGLWNRRCYGTTRARILLEFDINGHLMGEEFTLPSDSDGTRRLTVKANGTAPIDKVEIVKNGRVLFSKSGDGALDVEFIHTDKEAERHTDYYYAHVAQTDREQAWSSPIWVTA